MAESLAYLVGVMLGDGGVYGSSYTVFCRDGSEEFVKMVAERVERIFGFKPRISRASPNRWVASTNRRDVHDFLIELGYPKGRKLTTLRIPRMFAVDAGSRLEVAKGLFDAEGYCGADREVHGGRAYAHPYVGIDMIAKPLIKQLQEILEQLGIESTVWVKKPRAWGKNPQFSLVIKGLERVQKFRETVGFRHPEKMKKLDGLVKGDPQRPYARRTGKRCDDMVHP